MQMIQVTTLKNSRISVDIPTKLMELKDGEKPNEYQGCFRILTPKDGDKKLVWDTRDFAQIQEAKETFDKLVAEGLVPYRVGVDGKATVEVMDVFDPACGEVIFAAIGLLVGG